VEEADGEAVAVVDVVAVVEAVGVAVAAGDVVDGDEAGGPQATSRKARHRAPKTAMAEGAERCICSPESHETANNSSILDCGGPQP
jgi:hypothetical protein